MGQVIQWLLADREMVVIIRTVFRSRSGDDYVLGIATSFLPESLVMSTIPLEVKVRLHCLAPAQCVTLHGRYNLNLGICRALALSKAIVDHIKSDSKDDSIPVRYEKEGSEVNNRLVGQLPGSTVRLKLIIAWQWVLRAVIN